MKFNLHCALTLVACIGIVLCAALLSNAAEFKMQDFKMIEFKMSEFKMSGSSKSEGVKQQVISLKGKTQSVLSTQQADQKINVSQKSQKMPNFFLLGRKN